MKRERSLITALGFLLATAPLMFAQDRQPQAIPALPADILGPQLIVWSQGQKPQPVPQPLPPPDRPAQSSNPQRGQQSVPQADQKSQEPAAQSFTGTIVKDGSKYVLRASGTTYDLDDQDQAKQFEGKQVKVAGSLDASGHTLHITKIELIS